jgi:hypothetical protein
VPSNFIVLSDTHLGYDRSKLNTPEAQDYLASQIAQVSGGEVYKLILNGDFFEGCIPKDAELIGDDMISPFTLQTCQSFFKILTSRVKIRDLHIVPGNHDYAYWRDLIKTENSSPLSMSLAILGVPPPNYTYLHFPVYAFSNCYFHHGHFLDDLIIGQKSKVEYDALELIEMPPRPNINLKKDNSLDYITEATDEFVAKMWAPNSRIREVEWDLLRKDDPRLHCQLTPDTEPFQAQNGHNLLWFIDMMVESYGVEEPSFTVPNYLFLGHDHYGGHTEVTSSYGDKFKVINTGGWTDDGNKGITPHAHIVSWEEGAPEPQVTAIKL